MAFASAGGGEAVAIVVWLDHWHAVIARSERGLRAVVRVDRDIEPETTYLRRVVEASHDGRRLIVLGPDDERLAFDRLYESLYERPDRFVEVEAAAAVSSSELLDRLRLLDGGGLQLAGD